MQRTWTIHFGFRTVSEWTSLRAARQSPAASTVPGQFQIYDEKNDTITRYFPERVMSRRRSKTLSFFEKPTYGEFNNHSQVLFRTQWETFVNVVIELNDKHR